MLSLAILDQARGDAGKGEVVLMACGFVTHPAVLPVTGACSSPPPRAPLSFLSDPPPSRPPPPPPRAAASSNL